MNESMYFLIEHGDFPNVMLREAARFRRFRKFLRASKVKTFLSKTSGLFTPQKKTDMTIAGTSSHFEWM